MNFSFKLIITVFLLVAIILSSYLNGLYRDNEISINWVGSTPKLNSYTKKYAYITGGVNKPGVYEFIEGERVQDILIKAEGFNDNVDLEKIHSLINLSEVLKDGEHYVIPLNEKSLVGESNTVLDSNSKDNLKININLASKSELESLPGVGSSTADLIISGRPYNSIDDLNSIKGFGDKKFSQIKDFITVNE